MMTKNMNFLFSVRELIVDGAYLRLGVIFLIYECDFIYWNVYLWLVHYVLFHFT